MSCTTEYELRSVGTDKVRYYVEVYIATSWTEPATHVTEVGMQQLENYLLTDRNNFYVVWNLGKALVYVNGVDRYYLTRQIEPGVTELGNWNDGDVCTRCGRRGEFVRMALICPEHGLIGGC